MPSEVFIFAVPLVFHVYSWLQSHNQYSIVPLAACVNLSMS